MTSPSDQKFDHVMIDIETMSLSRHNALILSIGMIEFDPTLAVDGLKIGRTSRVLPSLAEQLMLGRHVDPGTQAWWAHKDRKAASAHWMGNRWENLPEAIGFVREFCSGATRVWANGNQFDLANIEELARQIGAPEMWFYRAPRDMRSFVEETPQTRITDVETILKPYNYRYYAQNSPDPLTFIDHEPVYDCAVQAAKVWQHWQS